MHSTENPDGGLVPVAPTALVVPQQADSDQHLIDLWLHGRSRHTQRAYRADAGRFLEAVEKPLHRITLGDIQQYAGQLAESGLEPSSVYRSMSAVKSLFAFGHRLGYLPFDVARPLRLPALRERPGRAHPRRDGRAAHDRPGGMPRNKAILLTLYAGGFRVAELCSPEVERSPEPGPGGPDHRVRQGRQDQDGADAVVGVERPASPAG